MDIKGEIDKNTVIVGDFNILLTTTEIFRAESQQTAALTIH